METLNKATKVKITLDTSDEDVLSLDFRECFIDL